MADIKKTLSQLMIDYADNSAGSITPQLLRNGFKTVVGSMVISAVTSNYPLVEDDIFINAAPASADITITLPSASTFIEKYYIIKNSSPTYNVIVAGSIDSLTNYTVSAGQTLGIESNGTTWVSYIKPIDMSGFATTGSLSNYATSSSVSTLSADVQNKAYTSSVNTQVNNLSSVYAPIGSYITSAQVSATYETIADAANKMYTSAAFTKTSADTLYAPISTSAAIINLSATYATITSVSALSTDVQNKQYTSAAFTKTSADTIYAPIATSLNYVHVSGDTMTGDLSGTSVHMSNDINVGDSGLTDVGILAAFASSANNYNQVIIRNRHPGAIASSDLIVTNDQSTSSTFYGDFGMNSSGFTGTPRLNLPNAVYLYSSNGELIIGTSTANNINFVVNNGTNNAMIITSAGNLSAGGTATFAGAVTASSTLAVTGAQTNSSTLTSRSFIVTQQALTPVAAGTQAWVLTTGNMGTFTLTTTTADCVVTTSAPTAGAFSWAVFIGHASAARNASLTQTGVTWIYKGASNSVTVLLGSIGISKRVLYRLYWQSATVCFVEQIASDDGIYSLDAVTASNTYATSANVATLSASDSNKLFTSAAFTKTSADTLYAPISTSATINGLSATYETITDAANKAYTSAISAALNAQDASTGIYFGGNVAKVDSTHFSVSATKGWIVDSVTNPEVPIYTFVSYPGSASITDQYVGVSGTSTYIYLTSAGAVAQQNSALTPIQKRLNLYLGFSYHVSAGTIQNVVNQPDIKINEFSQVRDMFGALKYINKGVSVTANGSNLAVNVIAGSLYGLGANWSNNNSSPTKLDISGSTSAIFQYRTQSDFGTPNLSAVDGTNYDLAGIVTAIPASGPAGGPKDKAQATNQIVYIAPSGNLRFMYGQTIYSSLAAALIGITSEQFIIAPSVAANLQLIGIITVTKGATSLIATGVDAQFTLPSMFGEVSIGAGGLATTNMQQAYLNSPIPQVKITSGNGPVEYQGFDNSSLTFAVLNSAGDIVYGVSANGATSATSAIANAFVESGLALSAKYIPKSQNDITKDPTGFFNPEGVTVTYTTSSRTVTLGGSVSAYWHGTLVPILSSGWVSSPCPSGTSATQYLYYNGTSAIWSSTPWTLDMLQIAIIGVDHADVVQFGQRECHGMMNWESHKDLHNNVGTYITSNGAGGDLSNYVLTSAVDAARRPYVSALTINDEDLTTILPTLSTATFTQYSLSTSAVWSTFTSAADIIQLSGNQPQYNLNNAGVWGQALISNNNYGAIFLAAIPVSDDATSQLKRFIWIQPQQINANLATIQALTPNSLTLGNLPSITPELVFFGRVIVRYSGGNWTIIQVDKIIGSKISQTTISGSTGLTTVTTDGTTVSGIGTVGSPVGMVSATTSGTYNNVVVDQYGRVTSGSSTASGSTALKFVATFPMASITTTSTFLAGASNNWVAYGTSFIPTADVTVTTASSMNFILNAAGNSTTRLIGVYRMNADNSTNLMFGTSATVTHTGTETYVSTPITTITSATLVGGVTYAIVIFTPSDNATSYFTAGAVVSTNMTGPRMSFYANNLGTLTSLPTGTISSMSNTNAIKLYGAIKV